MYYLYQKNIFQNFEDIKLNNNININTLIKNGIEIKQITQNGYTNSLPIRNNNSKKHNYLRKIKNSSKRK